MLKSITVNYETRDFFGNWVMRSDVETSPDGADEDKALRAVSKGCYVHFSYADGQRDCVYRDSVDKEDGTWTLVHWERENSQDAPIRVSPRTARKRIRARIAKGA